MSEGLPKAKTDLESERFSKLETAAYEQKEASSTSFHAQKPEELGNFNMRSDSAQEPQLYVGFERACDSSDTQDWMTIAADKDRHADNDELKIYEPGRASTAQNEKESIKVHFPLKALDDEEV